MKQLIIGLVLAVLLVGCGEKPKFSINETDTSETYANNPVFSKVEVYDKTHIGKTKDDKFGYQFTSAPISVYGIETSDLDILGGTVLITDRMLNTALTINGKRNFGKLDERLSKLKDFVCDKAGIGNSAVIQCMNKQNEDRVSINVYYNPFSDIVSFNYVKY